MWLFLSKTFVVLLNAFCSEKGKKQYLLNIHQLEGNKKTGIITIFKFNFSFAQLLECMRRTLDKVTNCFIAEEFLTQIENLFLSTYKSEKKSNAEENKNECSNESPM